MWFSVFLAGSSYGACMPFLPLYMTHELQTTEYVAIWTGAVFSVTFLGSSVMAPFWGAWADKVGQKRMAIRAGIGLAITYFLQGMCQNVEQLFIVRSMVGLIAGFVPASLSLVSSTIPAERVGWGMGLMQAALSSGAIMGPLMGGYLSSWFGMRTSFYVGGVALMLNTVLVLCFVQDLPHPKLSSVKVQVWQDIKTTLANRELLQVMLMFMTVQCCIMLINPVLANYVAELRGGLNDARTVELAGFVFSLTGIAGMLAATFWGKLGQRRGYTKTLSQLMFGAGLVYLGQIWVSSVTQLALVQFTYGLFLAGATPNINGRLVEITTAADRGKGFGLATSAQQMGGCIGPLLGGCLASFLPIRYVLIFTALIYLILGFYTARKTRI